MWCWVVRVLYGWSWWWSIAHVDMNEMHFVPSILDVTPPLPHPSQFSHLRLSSLHGDWLTVPNLGMVAPTAAASPFLRNVVRVACDLASYQNDQLSIIGPLGLFSGLFGVSSTNPSPSPFPPTHVWCLHSPRSGRHGLHEQSLLPSQLGMDCISCSMYLPYNCTNPPRAILYHATHDTHTLHLISH